jgi:hypothetical protein
MSLSKALRDAVRQSKESRYRISIDSGVDHAVLRRFMTKERDITLQTAEKLAAYFKLELTK